MKKVILPEELKVGQEFAIYEKGAEGEWVGKMVRLVQIYPYFYRLQYIKTGCMTCKDRISLLMGMNKMGKDQYEKYISVQNKRRGGEGVHKMPKMREKAV